MKSIDGSETLRERDNVPRARKKVAIELEEDDEPVETLDGI